MIYLDSPLYRAEALTYANAEITKRGIRLNQTDSIRAGSIPELPLAAFGRSVWKARGFIAFGIGFVSGLAYFVSANFESYRNVDRSSCYDCFVFLGFPFDLYQTGGFAGPTTFLWPGLIADIAIAMLVSAIVGLLLKAMVSRYFE